MMAANHASFDDVFARVESDQLLVLGDNSTVPPEPLREDVLRGIGLIQLQACAELDADAALQMIAERTLVLMRASGVAIGLLSGDEVVCRARAGAAPEIGTRLERDQGLSGECLRTGRIIRCADTAEDARVDTEACQELGLRSAVLLPISAGDTVLGVFDVLASEPHAFDHATVLALSKIAQLVAEIAAKQQQEPSPTVGKLEPDNVPAKVPNVRPETPFSLRKSATYVTVSMAVLLLMGYAALSYHQRAAVSPAALAVNVAPEPVPEAAPGPASPEPEAARPPTAEVTEPAPTDAVRMIAPIRTPQPEWKEEKLAVTGTSGRPLPAVPKKLGSSELPLIQPPAVAMPEASPKRALAGVIETPVASPKLAAPQPAPRVSPEPAAPSEPRQPKPRGLSRVLGHATKPVKALLKKDPKPTGQANPPSPPLPE